MRGTSSLFTHKSAVQYSKHKQIGKVQIHFIKSKYKVSVLQLSYFKSKTMYMNAMENPNAVHVLLLAYPNGVPEYKFIFL